MRRPSSMFTPRVIAVYRVGPVALGIRATASEIMIYDTIGADPWSGGGVSASDVVAALAKSGGGPVTVRINSPGGDVWDGLAIYNALAAHPGGVNVVVDGVAASAASFIAMAGKTVTMPESSMMMIHNARTLAYGQASDLNETAALLAKVDGQLAAIYEARTGKPAADMMQAETWFTAAEALAAGLCDTVTPLPTKEAEPAAVLDDSAAKNLSRLRNKLRLAIADS